MVESVMPVAFITPGVEGSPVLVEVVPVVVPPALHPLSLFRAPWKEMPRSRLKSVSMSTMAAWISTSSTGLSRSWMTFS